MTIPEIISQLENNQIPEALEQAKKIPFSTDDVVLYNRKREKYEASLPGQELLDWIREMKSLLLKYTNLYGNYESDPLSLWHHLDKRNLKNKFQDLFDVPDLLKIVILEFDLSDPFSLQVHHILNAYAVDYLSVSGEVKGDTGNCLLLNNRDNVEKRWCRFVRNNFDLDREIPVVDAFKISSASKCTFFIIHNIENEEGYEQSNFDYYCDLWHSLSLRVPLFLVFYVSEGLFSRFREYDSCSNFLICDCASHRYVEHGDFTLFLANDKYCKYYEKDLTLCDQSSGPMLFREAVMKLQYRFCGR